MNYADIKTFDINNGDGVRVSLWVTGCPFKCQGCHNSVLWDKDIGNLYTDDTENYIINLLNDKNIDVNLSILGGEPLAIWNYEEVLSLCKRVRKEFPSKTIWLWTGYNFDKIKDYEIMQYLDVVIDGTYIESLRDENTFWRGSTNQRKIVLKDLY